MQDLCFGAMSIRLKDFLEKLARPAKYSKPRTQRPVQNDHFCPERRRQPFS